MNRSVSPEFHDPCAFREKSVIFPDPDKIPGVITRPALPDNNASRRDLLPAIDLHTQAF